MDPPRDTRSTEKIPMPPTLAAIPQLSSQISTEALYKKLNTIFSAYFQNRFPYETPIPAIHIDCINQKTFDIGKFKFDGYGITAYIQQKMQFIHFEASKCFNLFRPLNELLSYQKEALDHILKILELPHSEIEVTNVKNLIPRSWGKLNPINENDTWTVECYSIEFIHKGINYHFYFDNKLRFFKNALSPSHVYLKPPLIRDDDAKECLNFAAEMLQMTFESLKITNVIPSEDGSDIGYTIVINDGLLEIFMACTPNYSKDPWGEIPQGLR